MKRMVLGAAAGCACGLLAGELLHHRSLAALEGAVERLQATLERRPEAQPFPAAGGTACAISLDADAVRAELRRALELAPLAAANNPAAGGKPDDVEPQPRPEREEALERGRDAVRRAEAKGAWEEEQASAFRAALAELDTRGREELLRVLIPAINEGRIRVETPGPPF